MRVCRVPYFWDMFYIYWRTFIEIICIADGKKLEWDLYYSIQAYMNKCHPTPLLTPPPKKTIATECKKDKLCNRQTKIWCYTWTPHYLKKIQRKIKELLRKRFSSGLLSASATLDYAMDNVLGICDCVHRFGPGWWLLFGRRKKPCPSLENSNRSCGALVS